MESWKRTYFTLALKCNYEVIHALDASQRWPLMCVVKDEVLKMVTGCFLLKSFGKVDSWYVYKSGENTSCCSFKLYTYYDEKIRIAIYMRNGHSYWKTCTNYLYFKPFMEEILFLFENG